MQRQDRLINLYLLILLPLGVGAVAWAVSRFPIQKVGAAMIVLSIVTVFFSSYLRLQLPRTKLHITISDTMVMLALLLYGGEVALILAVLETAFTSFNFKRQGVSIAPLTVLFNVLNAAVAVFFTTGVIGFAFGSAQTVLEGGDISRYVWLLALTAFCLFIVNSAAASAIVAARSDRPVISVWNEHCFNLLVMYLSGAVMAGVAAKALQQFNVAYLAAVLGFFALVYLTYRRYISDIERTSVRAERSERDRAEQAERHVQELKHYVNQLERSSRDLEESHERLRHVAYHDALTGLPNRNLFTERIQDLIGVRDRRKHNHFAILFLDLNRFKTINDSLGHSMGDKLIQTVGLRLSSVIRSGDLVGRFGGDEFAVLLQNVWDANLAVLVAQQLADRIAEPMLIEGKEVFTSVSIGIALSNTSYTKAEEILRDADIAMYYAKENQKSYEIFDQGMHERAVAIQQVETDLRMAIDGDDELELYYQPIVRLSDMELYGFEALVRWNHPTKGVVQPSEFIGISETNGLVIPMTLKLLEKACRQMREWEKTVSRERLNVSVNLSGRHFVEPGLVSQITDVLRKTEVDPSRLTLELTESAAMENTEHVIATLRLIKAAGVRISIDDFGTGYSSLSYLHGFPVDALKIDRSFVQLMEDGSDRGEIVRTILALARALRLTVVAEGIENIHQLHQLRILGCELGQGYLFARPLPVSEVEKILHGSASWETALSAAHQPPFPETIPLMEFTN